MKFKLLFIAACISTSMFSQEQQPKKDSLATNKKGKSFEFELDIVSRYLWRGQCWGGDYVAVQPTMTYKGIKNWEFEFWGTTNFKSEYAYGDGRFYKGYQEIDFSAAYYIRNDINIKVSDYYWPTVEKVDGVNNGFFNYGKDGVKTVDLSFNLDRTCDECDGSYPYIATLSVLVAGNDFRYDSNDENPKQNFTTYAEVGYMFTFFEDQKYEAYLTPVVGAVFNNKAGYYSYADYGKVSVCNMAIEFEKDFQITKNIEMPLTLNFTHNAADKNTEAFGRNFLVAAIKFKY